MAHSEVWAPPGWSSGACARWPDPHLIPAHSTWARLQQRALSFAWGPGVQPPAQVGWLNVLAGWLGLSLGDAASAAGLTTAQGLHMCLCPLPPRCPAAGEWWCGPCSRA